MENSKPVLILGLETSCDETSASVVENGSKVLSNLISTQIPIHRLYGGVVPEIASRQHLEAVNEVIDQALHEAGVTLQEITALAVTSGPGLVGALLVGVSTAKALAYALKIPLIAVNHMAGHIYANFLQDPQFPLPSLCLVVSGGHTDLIAIEDHYQLKILGSTRDDAAGEAFDKVARVLGLPYPGGPAVEKLAQQGNPKAYAMPSASIQDHTEWSFSGLKTTVINLNHKAKQNGEVLNPADLAASFQATVVDSLAANVRKELGKGGYASLMLAGGVAANKALRLSLEEVAAEFRLPFSVPSMDLCTDNAAMIAAAGYYRYLRGEFADLSLNAYPDLRLGQEIPLQREKEGSR